MNDSKMVFFQAWHSCWSLAFIGATETDFSKARTMMDHPHLMDLVGLDFVVE